MSGFSAKNLREAIIELFEILDTPIENRNEYAKPELLAFPYVNGSLFSDNDLAIPQMTDEIRDVLINKASKDFDWSTISPTIFGAVFESTLNPETRRSGGMHYTSIENIHKVIDPLFLNDLKEELSEIKSKKTNINQRVNKFQSKLASLKFLDPACGSGNFLTETYISLRKLEIEALEFKQGAGQLSMALDGDFNPIKVSIEQFYGIEINDFAVAVARTALWIAEHQMMKETERVLLGVEGDFLPLHTFAHITEGNALKMDWSEIVSKNELSYIVSNPPFIGARIMNPEQKQDVNSVFKGYKNAGNLDYVCCWFKKASDYMTGTNIETALVSTNSICQGESVANLWRPLFDEGVSIGFAYRSFRWDSEANAKAHVHCVIIGFNKCSSKKPKVIYDNNTQLKAKNINGYLIDADNIFVSGKPKPLCDVPEIMFGSKPIDNGYLSNYSTEEKDTICSKYPEAKGLFRRILGSSEFINGKIRYCIWLDKVSPERYKYIPPVMEAVNNVKQMRLSSKRKTTNGLAEVSYLFGEIRQPETDYLLIPSVSSNNREYVPIGFINKDVIATNLVFVMPKADMYNFGVLTSNVHMSWMRAVCGRLGNGYRYSSTIVYNTFLWPTPSSQQKEKIEATAQSILDARALYPDSSLADLYDPLTMPSELLKAHKANDKAVMQAYGFKPSMSESDIVSELMKMYQNLINEQE
ncbi:MAG: N-6 DNA methylase [Clostridiales bacterium]|nr:N-6 DNA methylase [Clostridiales bacterium]